MAELVEGAALEMRYTCKGIGGSNPSPTAKIFLLSKFLVPLPKRAVFCYNLGDSSNDIYGKK